MDFALIPPTIFDYVGIAGFCLYVATYTLLSLRLLSGNSLAYFLMNLIAASLVLIGLSVNFNLASALIQCFWITMSVIAIGLRLFRPGQTHLARA